MPTAENDPPQNPRYSDLPRGALFSFAGSSTVHSKIDNRWYEDGAQGGAHEVPLAYMIRVIPVAP